LARAAKDSDIGLTVDAEEADRLEIGLDIFAAVGTDPALAGWDGLGLVVQAYQKRALPLVDWTANLAARTGHRVPVRLVKGAYWDTEIKHAQQQGYADYPVFTRKPATDVSWIACALRMLARRDVLRPAFATHNAHSLAVILEAAGDTNFEMQRLHGMGEALYEGIVGTRPARYAFTLRSDRMRICWPTWCGACWRTVPTPVSCTVWSIRPCPRTRSSPTP
jgi:RHH-type proline utilization regulon transcriptional repressor/proline dehydrogenase/delta 1-pyrroline-5-carboxylate dehydrogenase